MARHEIAACGQASHGCTAGSTGTDEELEPPVQLRQARSQQRAAGAGGREGMASGSAKAGWRHVVAGGRAPAIARNGLQAEIEAGGCWSEVRGAK
jgi:hypothetical protein